MKISLKIRLVTASLLAFLTLASRFAWAHCSLQYQVIGPGGLFYQAGLGPIQNLGLLPGGTTSQLGADVSWTDMRYLDLSGTIQVTLTATDLTGSVSCPAISLNLDGPPSCSDDFSPEGFPPCTPSFTVTQTAPHIFSCSSSCVSYPQPHNWLANYYLGNSPAPPLSALSPQSTLVGTPALALAIQGSGFVGASQVQWTGSPLTTVLVSNSSLLALIPSSLIVSSGTNNVTVLNPGGTSSPLVFSALSLVPAPLISNIFPASAVVGSAALSLTIAGSNFISSSIVLWNGANRNTVFISSAQLNAQIPASDLIAVTTAAVTVFSSGPGGGMSAPQDFFVTAARPAMPPITSGTAQVVTSTGGIVTFQGFPGPTTIINVPSGAFNTAVTIAIQTPSVSPACKFPPGQSFSDPGVDVELSVSSGIEPSSNVGISLSYAGASLPTETNQSGLFIARCDTNVGVWIPLASNTDTSKSLVTAQTDRFSFFKVLAYALPSSVKDVEISNNPIRPARGITSTTLSNLPANARIRIYTISGLIVKDITTDASGTTTWDATNQSGRRVASGVYFVFAQSAGTKKTFKIAVQR